MNYLDFVVLLGTLLFIVVYGVWKTRGKQDIHSYLLAGKSLNWWTVGLSVMATQASAITFISTPGQAYESGMGFIQNYFGLPLAMIIVSAVFIPMYYRLKVYTAYEFLEKRFDLKTRMLGAGLFLVQRGLAAGITIYAPAIILATILNWNLNWTIIVTGILVMVYTVAGGSRAVSLTQKYQMAVIMGGMVVAFVILVRYITEYVPVDRAFEIAGFLGKLQAVDMDVDFEKRYTIWSGLAGGLFLALSYFGTDQSQVQRYIGGTNVTESRMGLMFNALLKIPMQFFILLVGVMVYIFYIFYQPPIHFNESALHVVNDGSGETMQELGREYEEVFERRKQAALTWPAGQPGSEFIEADQSFLSKRREVRQLMTEKYPELKSEDTDYVFLSFILKYLPHGLIGLLIAVIFSAAMSSTSSELNALASTTTIDFYKRLFKKDPEEKIQVSVSRGLTVLWGLIAISFALLAKNSENLIEAVNIVGSIFYGTILGIFIVAFFLRFVQGRAVFFAAILAQGGVFVIHWLVTIGFLQLGYLWYNVIGFSLTVLLSIPFQLVFGDKKKA